MLRIIRNIKGEVRKSVKYEERELWRVERSVKEEKSGCSESEKEGEEEYYKVFVM